MSGADVSIWASVRVSDRMWQELDSAFFNYGRLAGPIAGLPTAVARLPYFPARLTQTATKEGA
jgi:hypothetical protein